MSEYTPTTEQVREAFSEMSGWDMSADEADAAFDRWLAEVRAGVVAEEPEWEYRAQHPVYTEGLKDWACWVPNMEIAQATAKTWGEESWIERRRTGPIERVPVKQGDET